MSLWSDTPLAAKVGLVAGLIPFIVKIETMSTSSGAGGATCSYMNYVALIGGAIAAIAGIAVLIRSRAVAQDAPSAGIRYGFGTLVLALGVLQILIGLGALFGPCP